MKSPRAMSALYFFVLAGFAAEAEPISTNALTPVAPPIGRAAAECPTADPDAAARRPELQGILVTSTEPRFALVSSGGAHSGWAAVGQTFDGWTVLRHVPAEDGVVLGRDGREILVRLNAGSVSDGPALTTVRPTIAEADDLLGRMKFDAMWDRIAQEQKKAMIDVMREQAAPEFAKQGLAPAEIDALLGRMGDVIMSGMQSEQMRQDFARIYTEVYTKDELRGMADFYETAAGRSWVDKQPEVQQKLMQALMPRVMQGMPAAQAIATEYFKNRKR